MELLEVAKKIGAGKHHSTRNDDVFIDRLNHRYTVTMILVFAAVVTTQQYFGSAISCWVPAQFTGSYEKYANDICWIMNTYYIPMENNIPDSDTNRYERMLKYYQWSPFILLFMAFCFYFPRMIWRSLNNKSGLDVEKLVDAAMKQEQSAEPNEDRKKTVNNISNLIEIYIKNRGLSNNRNASKPGSFKKILYYFTFWRHRQLSAYIVTLFTIVKILYLINTALQIIFLNIFLGDEYHLFGIDVLKSFVRGTEWNESKRFPRVTLCDFHIREIGIVHRYTVQCVLPINLFNEKIFLILWFWILILAAFNIGDLLAWSVRILRVGIRSKYVLRKLQMKRASTTDDRVRNVYFHKSTINQFVKDYLKEDGCFVLRLLARNGQDIIAGEIIDNLYHKYQNECAAKHTNSDRPVFESDALLETDAKSDFPARVPS